MAREARLLVTVGRGGVRLVRSKNKSYVGQSKEKECAYGAPKRPGLKVFGLGCFIGASV